MDIIWIPLLPLICYNVIMFLFFKSKKMGYIEAKIINDMGVLSIMFMLFLVSFSVFFWTVLYKSLTKVLFQPTSHLQAKYILSNSSLISPSFQGGSTLFHDRIFLQQTPYFKT